VTSAPMPRLAQAGRGIALCAIAGLGTYRPPAGAALAARVSGADCTGVSYRVQAEHGVTTPSLAAGASRAALDASGVDPASLEMIIAGTTTPDVLWPSTACLVQTELKLPLVGAFDLYAAEASVLAGLDLAVRYVRSGAKAVLVIGAESDNQLVDLPGQSKGHGRAGAAMVLASSRDDGGVLAVSLGGAARPELNGDSHDQILLRGVTQSVDECLDKSGLTLGAVDLVIGEQSAPEVMRAWSRSSGVPASRLLMDPARYGSLFAVAPLMALYDAVADGRIKPGMTVLLLSCGSGPVWGTACLRWGTGGVAAW
jgi:3-oxoacyl-[acyl-carrier-protein] synthase III